jgi:Rab proteins geranylgeranyltransferase component A
LIRLHAYLLSLGRYGPSPFIVGNYGCIGEITQGFCRAAAVSGAVYILGRPSIDIKQDNTVNGARKFVLELEDVPGKITSDILLSSDDLLPKSIENRTHHTATIANNPTSMARAIIIIDKPLPFPTTVTSDKTSLSTSSSELSSESEPTSDPQQDQEHEASSKTEALIDTAVAVFPPGSTPGGSTKFSALAFVTGQNTLSAPSGKCAFFEILYLLHFAAIATVYRSLRK